MFKVSVPTKIVGHILYGLLASLLVTCDNMIWFMIISAPPGVFYDLDTTCVWKLMTITLGFISCFSLWTIWYSIDTLLQSMLVFLMPNRKYHFLAYTWQCFVTSYFVEFIFR